MQLVAHDPRANGGRYIIASSEAPSGRGLYDAIREALAMEPARFAVPAWTLRAGGQVGSWLESWTGKRMPIDQEIVERLLGSAWYSPTKIEQQLGWKASCTLGEGLREMFGK
jgi:nucleoside-diphosphate-sugar epimerase